MRLENTTRCFAFFIVVLLAVGVAAGGVTAAPADSVELQNPADGQPTTHTWNATLSAESTGTLDYLVVDYTGSGANVSAGPAFVPDVTANGSTVSVSSTRVVSDTELNLTLSSPVPVSAGDRVEFTVHNVQNPASAGTYTASIALNNTTGTFATESESFGVVEGGHVNGTVTNTTGTTLSGATVRVQNASTNDVVDSTTTDAQGNYSHYVPGGSYTLRISKSSYVSNQTAASVTAGASTRVDATLTEAGYINGTVTNASGQRVGGLAVTAYNATTNSYVTADTTDQQGNYSLSVEPGKYAVSASSQQYASDEVNVTIPTPGAEATQEFTVEEKGYLNGTVTDSGGTPLAGISLVADERNSDDAKLTTTAGDGSFSVRVAPGQYDLVAYNNPDYEFELSPNLTVASGATTQTTLSLTAAPTHGTIEGTVVTEGGAPVAGAKVSASDLGYTYYNSTTTDSNGEFSLSVPASTYQVRANAQGLPATRQGDVEVTGEATTSVTLTVERPRYITGRVTNASGDVANVPVVADDGDAYYFNRTNATGHYNITAGAGEYTVSVFASGQDAASETVDLSTSTAGSADFTLQKTEVVAKDVAIESGPGDESTLGVNAEVRSGLLQVQLVNESATPTDRVGKPQELETLGVTDSTEFSITVTVTNFSADSLLWGLDDANYSTSPNGTVENGTDVTITGKPVTLQATEAQGTQIGPLLMQSPADVQWPTERDDRADVGFNQTVYVGVFDLGTVPSEVRDTLRGVSVTTNAQTFSTPSVVNESLRIWIAGPSKTVDGEDHTGFYQATIPQAQLDEWGVDDPETELQTLYKGSERDFTVTETSGGARIRLENIGYSAGFVEVEAETQSTQPSSSSGGTTGDTDSADDGANAVTMSPTPTETETATPTVTETDVPTAAATTTAVSEPAATATSTATVTDAEASTQTTSARTSRATSTASSGTTRQTTPGFGVGLAVLALLAAGLLARRRP